jgi:hypothetical protein
LHVKRIKRPAAEAGPKRAPLRHTQFAVPIANIVTPARLNKFRGLSFGN